MSAGAECTLSCSGNPAGRMSEVTDDESRDELSPVKTPCTSWTTADSRDMS